MRSFSKYNRENSQKGVVLFWGRCNPPTIGHEKAFNFGAKIANQNGYVFRIYLTHTNDKKKNPLSYDKKISYLQNIFLRYSKYVTESDVRTVTQCLQELEKTFSDVIMVTGADRVDYFQNIFDNYNGKDYNFTSIKVLSAGDRDPESSGAAGISGSKMREFVKADNIDDFSKGLPGNTDRQLILSLFNDIRSGLGLEKRKGIEIEASEAREYFFKNSFETGQKVKLTDGTEGVIQEAGTNYLTLIDGRKIWPENLDV